MLCNPKEYFLNANLGIIKDFSGASRKFKKVAIKESTVKISGRIEPKYSDS